MPEFLRLRSPDGKLSLECCPAIGGSITSFRSGAFDLFRPYDAALPLSPLNASSFPLTPYSNRIIDCTLAFEGESLNVGPPTGKEPHQLHGDGWLLLWTVAAHHDHQAALALKTQRRDDTPYVYEAAQTYVLGNDSLTIDMSVTNLSGRRLPFGLGHHPYFNRNDKTTLKANLPFVWQSKNIVPQQRIKTPPEWDFSQGIALSDAHFLPPRHGIAGADLLDHCFAGWDGTAEIEWPEAGITLALKADPVFEDFVIYIPAGQNFFCAEAVTHINDGFNLQARGVEGTGTKVLEDGQTLSASMIFAINSGN